jgi:uncharacterized protein YhaN
LKITGLHIDGFGIFQNRSISGMNPGLVMIQGENETGKSTLLGFIRSVLFGFPRTNAKGELFYPPIAGGMHGGRIDFVVNSGEAYTVSRSPGKQGGRVSVKSSLGVTGDGEDLTRLLGGVSYEVFRNIFAFGLSELESMETLEGDGVRSAIYGTGVGTGMMLLPRAKKWIQSRMEALFKAGGTKPLMNAAIYELEKVNKALLAAGPQIRRYDQAVDEKREIEEKITLVVKNLDQHRLRQQALSAYGRLWPEWISLQENEYALTMLTPLVTVFPEEGILRLEKESAACKRFEAELAELLGHREQLGDQMERLAVDTTLLARGIVITELVQEKGAYLEKTTQLPTVVREKTALDMEIKNRLEALGEFWRNGDMPGNGSGWLESYIERFDTSPPERHRVEVFSDRLTAAREAVRSAEFECREKAAILARANEKVREATVALIPAEPLQPWLTRVAGILAAIGSIWWHGHMPLSQASAFASAAILAYLFYLLHHIHTIRDRQQFEIHTLQRLTREAGECQRSATEAASGEARAKAVFADELNAWQAHLKMLGLAETLSPSAAVSLFFKVEAVATAISRRSHLMEEIHRLETELFRYHRAATTLWQELGRAAPEAWEPPSIVEMLFAGLEESRGNQREKTALEAQLHSLSQRITAVRRQMEIGRNHLRMLLAEAGAETETDFCQQGRAYAERLRLIGAIAENEKILRRISGEYDMAALKHSLKDLTLSEIMAREKAEEEAVGKIELELDDLRNRRAELGREIATLSSDEDLATLRSEEMRLRAALQAHVFDWSRHALAGYLLDQARESFETAHQPQVLQDAGRFFDNFTGGRYIRLVAPMGEKTLYAVTTDSRSVSPEALSRGTVEQLYLAVRFGFIRHRAKRNEPLPVVMDDILVNFDPHRAQAAAGAIAELSRTHQVLFFTCHPETIDRFRNTNADVQVIDLPSGDISAGMRGHNSW